MSDTPATQLRRLEREQQARTLRTKTGGEPRLSLVDEQRIADAARLRSAREARASVLRLIADLRAGLDELAAALPAATPGIDHRSNLRMGRRVLDALERSVSR